MPEEKVHSENVLFQPREVWWNEDFLNLLSHRWDLKKYKSLLDVGVGLGHWSRSLLRHIHEDFEFAGIDIEQQWVQQAPVYFYRTFPSIPENKFRFLQSDAHELPFQSDYFDVVTCQTVLMHLRNPTKALEEMKRVTKRGGLIICVEPINLFNRLEVSSATQMLSLGDRSALYAFWTAFHRGKFSNGLGDNDIGMYLPGLFKTLGLEKLQVFQNDKLIPTLGEEDFDQSDFQIEEYELEFARKGGADQLLIEAALKANASLTEIVIKLQGQGLYYRTGNLNMVICSGIKP